MADPVWTTPVNITANTKKDSFPNLQINGDGTIFCVYAEDQTEPLGDVHVYSKQGASASALAAYTALRIDTEVGNCNSAETTSSALTFDGKIHFVWTQVTAATSATDVYYANKTVSGAWSTPENVTNFALSTNVATRPSVAVDPTGRQVVCFEQNTSPVHVKTRAKVSGVWGDEITWNTMAATTKNNGNLCSSANGDIWLVYTDDDSGASGNYSLNLKRLNFTNPQLDPGTSGNWTSVGTWESATYMLSTTDGINPVISARSRNDYCMTWNGQTTGGGAKYHALAAWSINGRTSPALSGMTGNATSVYNRLVGGGVTQFRLKHDMAVDGQVVMFEEYTVADPLNPTGTPRYLHWWLLKNNTWSTVKQGPEPWDDTTRVFFPSPRFKLNSGKIYVAWYQDD